MPFYEGVLSGTGAWGKGCWDVCLGHETWGHDAWDVGTSTWGDVGHRDVGRWGREISDAGTSRLETRDWGRREVRNKRNHFLL